MDMLAQTLIEHFLAHLFAFLVGEHPVSKLSMPAETVSTHLQPIFAAEVGDAVGLAPGKHTLLGLHRYGFHLVLRSDAVEVLFHYCHLFR